MIHTEINSFYSQTLICSYNGKYICIFDLFIESKSPGWLNIKANKLNGSI